MLLAPLGSRAARRSQSLGCSSDAGTTRYRKQVAGSTMLLELGRSVLRLQLYDEVLLSAGRPLMVPETW